jgi:hypothetical protein
MALLWITGCAWLVLRYFFQVTGEFGPPAPHPMQLRLMMVHGVLALAAVFFFGWVAGSPSGEQGWQRMSRSSAIVLVTLFSVLTLTGVCSYYLTSERLRVETALIRQVAGAFAILPALYWLRIRGH